MMLMQDRFERGAWAICQVLPYSDTFNHIGWALYIKGIPFHYLPINKKSYTIPTILKCYAHRKKTSSNILTHHLRGEERGWIEGVEGVVNGRCPY